VRKKKDGRGIGLDLSLSSLVGELTDLVEGVSETMGAAATAAEEHTRGVEFNVEGLGDKARGVYGFSIRTGLGGIPRVERFGNMRATEEGAVVADVREPLVDLFDEDGEIVVVAELPGVAEDEIHIEMRDDVLYLETTGERRFAKEIASPEPVDPTTLRQTYNNGILDIRMSKLKKT